MSESKRDFPRAARRRPPGPKNPMVLLAALSDEYVGIRIYAAARLGGNDAKLRWSDVPTTVRHLTKALGDTDSRVAIQAAASLAGYRSVAGMRFLMEPANSPLLRSQDDGTRRCVGALVMAMGEFGLREGTPWIIAQCEKHPELVPLAVETMWAMRDAASIDFLGEVLVDKEMKGRVRDRALFSLSRTMDNRAFPYIRKVLEEAEKGGEWRMVSSCLVAMSMIHPDLSFDHLARWARPHSAGKAKRGDEESGGVSRTAFLVLHHKSGYPDVVRQLGSAPGLMRKGMERFWTEKKEILDAWDEMRHARYTSPSPTRERLAWRKLANTVNSASKTTRKIVLQCGEFYWDEKTSRDGTLKIRKVVKDGGLSLTVTER